MPPRRKKPAKNKKSSIPELEKGVSAQKITNSKNAMKKENESCRSLRPRQGKDLIKENIDSSHRQGKQEQFDFKTSTPICEDYFYDNEASSGNFENSDDEEVTNEMLLKDYCLLLSLQKQEEDLKIAILYEKLKKEEDWVNDKDLLCKSILELKNETVKIKEDLKAKNTMYPYIQISEVMQEILNPRDAENDEKFFEEEKKLMQDVLLERKELKKKISEEQLEITAYEEECLQLRLTMDKTIKDLEKSKHTEPDPEEEEELKQLEKDNQSRGSRIQLLSKIVKVLIDNIEEKEDLIELNKLSSACEKILKWNYDDIDEIEDLCKAVYTTVI